MTNDAKNANLHAPKKVLIEHITDDVKQLRKSGDVQQQSLLLSGRALKDFNSAARFEAALTDSSSPDYKYTSDVSGTRKIDFDKLVDTDLRYVASDTWTNGPSDLMDGLHRAGVVSITAILPSGALTWDTNLVASRADAVTSIRQIFYPDDREHPSGFTRVGNRTSVGGVWNFGDWESMSAKDLTRVLVTRATRSKLGTLTPNTLYELHLSCDDENDISISLPDASNYPTGTTIAFEQYPNPDAIKALGPGTGANAPKWSSTVVYSSYDPNTVGHEVTDFTIKMQPSIDTVSVGSVAGTGAYYEDARSAVLYKFVVVDLAETFTVGSQTISRMWMLETDQDCHKSISEIIEMIDNHTEQVSGDLVNMMPGNESAFDAEEKTITFAPNTRGNFKLHIQSTDDPTSWGRAPGFYIAAYLNDLSDSPYVYTPIARGFGTINSSTKYYYQDEAKGTYELVGWNGGYISSWDDVPIGINTIYTRSNNPDTATLATLVSATDFENESSKRSARFFYGASKYHETWFNETGNFIGFIEVPVGKVLTIKIVASILNEETGTHYLIKNQIPWIRMQMYFIPDQHNQYVIKEGVKNISGSSGDLAKEPGIGDIASAASVAAIRDTIVGNLQSKGMYFGNASSVITDLNNCINAGTYTLTTAFKTSGVCNYSNLPTNLSVRGSMVLMVMDSTSFSPDKILPGNDKVITGDGAAVPNTTNKRIVQILFAERAATDKSELTGDATGISKMWLRYGFVSQGSTTWSKWATFAQDRMATTVSPVEGSVSSNEIKRVLDEGYTNISIDGVEGASAEDLKTVTVTLPDPDTYPDIAFQIEIPAYHHISLVYGKMTGDPAVAASYTTYEFTSEEFAEDNNKLLLNIEHNDGLWYIVAAG